MSSTMSGPPQINKQGEIPQVNSRTHHHFTQANSTGLFREWQRPALVMPQKPFNLGNLMNVQQRHINNRKCRDSGVQGQFDRSRLLREMTFGVWWGFLNKGLPTPAYFDWRGWFRAGLPFFRGDMIEISSRLAIYKLLVLGEQKMYPEYIAIGFPGPGVPWGHRGPELVECGVISDGHLAGYRRDPDCHTHAGLRRRMTLDEYLQGELCPARLPPTWVSHRHFVFQGDDGGLSVYDARTDLVTTLVSNHTLQNPMAFTNSKPNYRSTKLNSVSRKGRRLGWGGEAGWVCPANDLAGDVCLVGEELGGQSSQTRLQIPYRCLLTQHRG
ncbi:hypothetical protein J6590_028075 [Homalodisca vitripennis]|nr:hypothetical protein J6590_028075 [Homalodisca vitripennis]